MEPHNSETGSQTRLVFSDTNPFAHNNAAYILQSNSAADMSGEQQVSSGQPLFEEKNAFATSAPPLPARTHSRSTNASVDNIPPLPPRTHRKSAGSSENQAPQISPRSNSTSAAAPPPLPSRELKPFRSRAEPAPPLPKRDPNQTVVSRIETNKPDWATGRPSDVARKKGN